MNAVNTPKVTLDTLGCKVNQAETENFAHQLLQSGFSMVDSPAAAGLYILNTCTVTHIADRKSRHLLRMARRANPGLFIVATGCYAQRDPSALARLGIADLVLKQAEKPQLLNILQKQGRLKAAAPALSSFSTLRTRAFIKIQDGCTNFCTYCIVPLVRGREASLPAEDILFDIRERVAQGCKEVVLTGVRVGAYSFQGMNLKDLLQRVLRETGVARLRLSSLQPQEISPDLIDLWRDERLCPHFHLSLQSGSDSVLRRMGRRYSTAEYRRALSLVRSLLPDAAITTDVIVGFPGETDAEFDHGYDFCREMGFARIHVFPYSPRPGTAAALMPQTVAETGKRERVEKMLSLAQDSVLNYRKRFTGRKMLVLWEKQSGGLWSGFTGNYLKAYSRSPSDLTNKLESVTLS